MKNIQNNNGKNKKKFRPMGKVWERPGRGHGSELFVFLVFPWFFAVWPNSSRTQKKKVQTHGQGLGYPHTNQKNKKTKNQKTKKPKNQKTKKNKKNKIAHPKGRGSDAECWVLSFCFFCFFCFFGFLVFWFFGFLVFCFFCFFGFLFFWFFGFLVCVWIAIADVPSRDCQALSVVALEVGQAKPKKPKKQKTKKPKNQKTKKAKKQKKQDCTPQGEGVRCRVLGLVFLFFWFFGLIAIADVPSRDCQALSVVALEVGQAKTKKTKKQKTKKPRNQKTKKTKKTKKTRLHTPRGGGQMQSVGSCLFVFFGFLVFWFVCG